jgi:NAD(P)-dependent dehydrogenase (short-subunit alcohol dehydrogenase family)
MKTILVTGANRGIGFQVCKELSSKGHRVILTARNEEKGQEAAKSLNSDAMFQLLDIGDSDSIGILVSTLEEKFGHLDVLINNAAIIDSRGIMNASIEEIRSVMETNFYGPLKLTQALIPLLKKSTDGRIINVSSGMGAINELGTGYAGYRLSKTALNAQTILFANELVDHRITVNAVCPGWVKTDMGGKSAPRSLEKGAETIVWLALENNTPSGKLFRDKKVISW